MVACIKLDDLTPDQLDALRTIAGSPPGDELPPFWHPPMRLPRPQRKRLRVTVPRAILVMEHGETVLAELVAMELVSVHAGDDPVPIVTFTPYAAKLMALAIFERTTVEHGDVVEHAYWDHAGKPEPAIVVPQYIEAQAQQRAKAEARAERKAKAEAAARAKEKAARKAKRATA